MWSQNLKREWNIVFTGYLHPKSGKSDLLTIWAWSTSCTLSVSSVSPHNSKIPFEYLIFGHDRPVLWHRNHFFAGDTPNTRVLDPAIPLQKGSATEEAARLFMTGKLMTYWGLISILGGVLLACWPLLSDMFIFIWLELGITWKFNNTYEFNV